MLVYRKYLGLPVNMVFQYEQETLAYGFTTLTSPNFFLASSVEVLGGTITSSPGLNNWSALLALNAKESQSLTSNR